MAGTEPDGSPADPSNPRIVRDDVQGGEPRVAGRRVTVLQLYEQVEGRGLDAETVAERLDVDIADVYRALAYYHEHPQEMHAVRERREEAVSEAFGPESRD